jgi:prepilin-type processing-associated H-X9-DG protein
MVIIVVIGLLAGIILPSLNKARLKANANQCADQHRQLGQAYGEYIADDQRPIVRQKMAGNQCNAWERKLLLHAGQDRGWHCPDCRQGHHGVGYNHALGELGDLSRVKQPESTVVFGDAGLVANPGQADPNEWVEKKTVRPLKDAGVFEVPASANWKSKPLRMVNRHLGRASAVFADGHVEALPVGAIGFQYEAGHKRAFWDH